MSQISCQLWTKMSKSSFCYSGVWGDSKAFRDTAIGYSGRHELSLLSQMRRLGPREFKWLMQSDIGNSRANYLYIDVPCSNPCCFQQEWDPHTTLTLQRLQCFGNLIYVVTIGVSPMLHRGLGIEWAPNECLLNFLSIRHGSEERRTALKVDM